MDPDGLGGGWILTAKIGRWVDLDSLGGGWILTAWEVGGS